MDLAIVRPWYPMRKKQWSSSGAIARAGRFQTVKTPHTSAASAAKPKNGEAPQRAMLRSGNRIVRPAHWKLGGNAATECARLLNPRRFENQRGSRRKESRLFPRKAYGKASRIVTAAATGHPAARSAPAGHQPFRPL